MDRTHRKIAETGADHECSVQQVVCRNIMRDIHDVDLRIDVVHDPFHAGHEMVLRAKIGQESNGWYSLNSHNVLHFTTVGSEKQRSVLDFRHEDTEIRRLFRGYSAENPRCCKDRSRPAKYCRGSVRISKSHRQLDRSCNAGGKRRSQIYRPAGEFETTPSRRSKTIEGSAFVYR